MTHRTAGAPGAFIRLRASGWIISLCLHGTALVVAAMFAARVGLAPPSALFHWDVTVVNPSGAPSTTPLPTIDQSQRGSKSADLRAPKKPSPPRPSATRELLQPSQSALTTDVTRSTLQASPFYPLTSGILKRNLTILWPLLVPSLTQAFTKMSERNRPCQRWLNFHLMLGKSKHHHLHPPKATRPWGNLYHRRKQLMHHLNSRSPPLQLPLLPHQLATFR